jgi:EmrB/QacA subfamily drug resistance transporter
MENLDSTVLSTSLPAIAQDFGISPIQLKLALTAYLIALAIFIPASGWLADRLGARLIFRVAIATFTFGSILCGLSHSIGGIIFSRIVQGIGGAMMVPVGRLVILRTVTKAELVGSLAWLTMPALIGPVIGPPIGGFITTYFAWRWIFWINVPVGVLGLILATLFIPDVHGDEQAPFDWVGFLLSGSGLASLMAGSTTLGLGLLPPLAVIVLLVTGTALVVAYVRHSRRPGIIPIIDLTLLKIPTFRHTLSGGLLFRIGIGGLPFLLPLLLQVGFGMSPFQSGLITFASAIGAISMKLGVQQLLRRFGFRRVFMWNTYITSAFVAMPALFTVATPIWLMTGLLLISGFFRSLQFTSINALSFADIPSPRMSKATTLTSVAQQLSLSLGISIGAITLELVTDASGGTLRAASFWPAFLVVAAVAFSSIIPLRWLADDAGEELSGRHSHLPDPVTAMRERA